LSNTPEHVGDNSTSKIAATATTHNSGKAGPGSC